MQSRKKIAKPQQRFALNRSESNVDQHAIDQLVKDCGHQLTQEPYPLEARKQFGTYSFADTGLQFLALNSAWEIDEYFHDRSSINDSALSTSILSAEKST